MAVSELALPPVLGFFDRNNEERPEIIEGLLREGDLAVFAGDYGLGKSPVIADLAINLINGLSWCGRKVTRRPAVVFDFETAVPDYKRAISPQHVADKPGVLLFIHGGIWIVGNFQNHQRLLRDLVVRSGQVGVFVEYTSLPKAKYPTQMNESYAALKWVVAHAEEFGADGSRIAIAGNSVGGNMSAALALMAKDKKGPKIALQVLFIPATDASVDTESYHEYGTDRFLARAFMKYRWDLYAPDEKTRNSPLRASNEELQGLPPALVITSENDPLRDEGEAYARKLKDAGVAVTATRYNGMIHDFVLLNAIHDLPGVQAAINQAGDAIRVALKQ